MASTNLPSANNLFALLYSRDAADAERAGCGPSNKKSMLRNISGRVFPMSPPFCQWETVSNLTQSKDLFKDNIFFVTVENKKQDKLSFIQRDLRTIPSEPT